jgi:hypothetical protein
MPSLNQDIELWQADDAVIDVSVIETDGVTPTDLTGFGLRWELFDIYDRARVLIAKTAVDGGIEAVDLADGMLQVRIDAADTAPLGGQPFAHQLLVADPGYANAARVVLTGGVTIHKTILR